MINPTIVVAGGSGYIGRSLIPALLEKFSDANIIVLSRSSQSSKDPRVQSIPCDLFSLSSLENAIPQKIDLAVYLVHSMGPTAHLDQGSFADYDLILADNFARVLSHRNVKQVIYLGGLIPQNKILSKHLESRLEVEETFSQYKLTTTFFRAGLIIGEQGSSFQILLKLVNRLPIMICPKWTQTLTTPVDLDTVIESLQTAALNSLHYNKTYDLAGSKPLTYLQMMRDTAKALGQRRFFITVPFFTPTLSRLWVKLITRSPKNLVYPLIESLDHSMIASTERLFPTNNLNNDYLNILAKTNLKILPSETIFKFKVQSNTVRSVQRLYLPQQKNAVWVIEQYIDWLPKFLKPLIRVKRSKNLICFSLLFKNPVMLQLNLSDESSNADMQLLYIQKGLLVSEFNKGRLEFRVVLNRKYILAAIHDYRPALPWFIYKYTQALLHLVVMGAFNCHLMSIDKRNSEIMK